jgi:glycosyltransferase involved in cell wall biosynthesis
MQLLVFFNGDFNEGNAANARLQAYGLGLKEEGIEAKFYIVKPTEFGGTGINEAARGSVNGLSYRYLGGLSLRPERFLARGASLVLAWWSAWGVLFSHKASRAAVYCYGPKAGTHLPILLLARLLGYRCTIELTELHSLAVRGKHGIKPLLVVLNHALIELSLPLLCHQLVVATERLRKWYRFRFPNLPIEVIPITFIPHRYHSLHLERTHQVGYLGSFGRKDGVPVLLEAFALVKKQWPALKLLLIGYQSREFDLEAELNMAGLANDTSIRATGQVRAVDIPQLLASCDTLALPRIDWLYAHYGLPIKLAEYLATGRPVISSDVSDIGRYLGHRRHILLVPPSNSQALAQALALRYANYQEFDDMGKRGQERGAMCFGYKKAASCLSKAAFAVE